MPRPTVSPDLLARLLAAAPARLRRRLDEAPRLAEAWSWHESGAGSRIVVDAETTVTLAAAHLASPEQASCTCLLSPRCLHVLACVNLLAPSADPGQAPAAVTAPPPAGGRPGQEQRAAAEAALDAIGLLLAGGARAAGAVVQAELFRAVHHARSRGCHRLAATLTAATVGVRGLRAGDAATAAGEVRDDLRSAAVAALAVLAPDATEADLGTARRAYHPLGGLRLHGVLSEPVLTRSGHAGIVTWLVDGAGRLWSLADVQPGSAARIPGAWAGGVGLGDLSLPHRELVRGGALVQDATGSDDGRLGAGSGVQAVRAAGAAWDEQPVAALFARGLAEQIAAALAVPAQPGRTLVFSDGVVAGADDGALLVMCGERMLRLLPASWDASLPAVGNLRSLAAAPGCALRFAARLLPDRPWHAVLLAIAPDPARLPLPRACAGRLMAGLEHLPPGPPGPALAELPLVDAVAPWEPLERRVLALMLGGRGAFPPTLGATIDGEAEAMRRRLCGHAAARLTALHAAARSTGDRWGRQVQHPPGILCRAWAAAAMQAQAAREALARSAWTAGPSGI